jgi:hypothetical protein
MTDMFVWHFRWMNFPNWQEQTTTDRRSFPVRTVEFDLIDNEAESPDLFYRHGLYCEYADLNFRSNINLNVKMLQPAPHVATATVRLVYSIVQHQLKDPGPDKSYLATHVTGSLKEYFHLLTSDWRNKLYLALYLCP